MRHKKNISIYKKLFFAAYMEKSKKSKKLEPGFKSQANISCYNKSSLNWNGRDQHAISL